MYKTCSMCQQTKRIEEFHKAAKGKYGVNNYCKLCNNQAVKIYRQRHPEKIKKTMAGYRELNIGKMIYNAARLRATKKSIPFNIELSDIVIPEYCPYLKIKLETKNGNGRQASSPSLDRVVPELGYVKGNIEVISDKANMMKSNANKEELLNFSREIFRRYEMDDAGL